MPQAKQIFINKIVRDNFKILILPWGDCCKLAIQSEILKIMCKDDMTSGFLATHLIDFALNNSKFTDFRRNHPMQEINSVYSKLPISLN